MIRRLKNGRKTAMEKYVVRCYQGQKIRSVWKERGCEITVIYAKRGLFVHFKRKVLFKISYSNLKTHSYNS